MLYRRVMSVLFAVAVLVLPAARAQALTYDEVVSAGTKMVLGATTGAVTWTQLANATANAGTVSATGGSTAGAWDKGAKSVQLIASGDGYFEFTKPDSERGVLAGLSADSAVVPANQLSFGLEFYASYIEVRENAVYKKDVTYVPGDVFRVAVVGGQVSYAKNGSVFYTSTSSVQYPLAAFATFSAVGQSIVSGTISYTTVAVAPTPPTTVPSTPTVSTSAALSISGVQITDIQPTSAKVTWATTVPADSYVRFGTTTRMNRSAQDANAVTSHTFALTGLLANKTYYYQVRSRAGGSTVYSTRATFKTVATPAPTPTPVPVAQTVIDGYGDTLATDGSSFVGWFYDSTGQASTASITYVNTATSQTYTQQTTRSVVRTDAYGYLLATYPNANLTITQPLGFNIAPAQVVTVPGTYKIQSFKLNNQAGSLIQLSSAAQGTFVIPGSVSVPPPVTAPPPPPVVSGTSLVGVTDKLVHAPPTTGTYAYNIFKPALGQSYVDPIFGTTVTRMSDNGGAQGDGTLYVANGLWNADGTYHIYDDAKLGSKSIVNTSTGATMRTNVGYDTNSQFDPVNPDVLYKWSGANLVRYNVSTGVDTVVKTFPGTLQSLGGSLDWISADGQYFLLAWNGQLHIWNKALDVIYSGAITKTIGSGWAAITPDGKYVVIVDDPADNRYSYVIDHAARTLSSTGVMFWNESSDDHSDLVSASDGKNYLILFENNYVAGVYAVDISQNMAGKTPDQQRAANRKLLDLDWSVQTDGHFSCVGRGALRDWCVISTVSTGDIYNSSPSPWYAFKQEIFAVNALTGEVRRFAHHRSRSVGMTNYYAFPRADVNWDGTKLWFASNFNTAVSYYSDVYKVDIAK